MCEREIPKAQRVVGLGWTPVLFREIRAIAHAIPGLDILYLDSLESVESRTKQYGHAEHTCGLSRWCVWRRRSNFMTPPGG